MKYYISNNTGSAYWVENDILMYAPMYIDGTFNTEEGAPVEDEFYGEMALKVLA